MNSNDIRMIKNQPAFILRTANGKRTLSCSRATDPHGPMYPIVHLNAEAALRQADERKADVKCVWLATVAATVTAFWLVQPDGRMELYQTTTPNAPLLQ